MSSWGWDKQLSIITICLLTSSCRDMQSAEAYLSLLLKNRCSTVAELKTLTLALMSTSEENRLKNMFTSILSVCPPSSVTSKLDRAASTSSISGSLEWARGSLDTVSLQMWYWGGKQRKPPSLIRAIIKDVVPQTTRRSYYEVLQYEEDFRGYAREAWVRGRFERSRVCQSLQQCVGECNTDLNHCPNGCKTPAERLGEGLKCRRENRSYHNQLIKPRVFTALMGGCTSHRVLSSLLKLLLCPCLSPSSGNFLMSWRVLTSF